MSSSDSAGGISCHTCLGVTSKLQGGHILHSLEGCDVGFYRAPCVNRCVFPDAGNVRGQCIACNNAFDIHAVYTSPGTPHTEHNCAWTCAASYTKVSMDGREKCVKNSTSVLGVSVRQIETTIFDPASVLLSHIDEVT